MGWLRRVAEQEWARWRRLFHVWVRHQPDVPTGEEGQDSEPPRGCEHDTSPDLANLRAETERREEQARIALRDIKHKFHQADQPLTVARAKASMLRRLVED